MENNEFNRRMEEVFAKIRRRDEIYIEHLKGECSPNCPYCGDEEFPLCESFRAAEELSREPKK